MKLAALFLGIALTISCSHVQQTAEECAKQVTPDLVHRVDSVIAGADYEAQLETIGASVALCILRAAVIEVESAAVADTNALAAHDAVANAKISHAQAWLATHGGPPVVTVKAGLPGGGNPGFCCVRSDGHIWTVGDVDPVTGQVMTSQTQVNGACGSGHLPVRHFGC